MLKKTSNLSCTALLVFTVLVITKMTGQNDSIRSWRAGDHHIHSKYSAGYDTSTTPPIYNFEEQPYSILTNAEKAKQYGLDWMVATDHGGPNHAKINLENAYPELLKSREKTPEVIQFHGMEFDAPSADHNSLIIPHSDHEHTLLYEIESQFATKDVFPRQPERETEEHMLKAITYMKNAKTPPVLISNHPSRGADSLFEYAHKEPREFRNWNNLAPNVAVGMEGAPGHQAGNLKPDGSLDTTDSRPYGNQTMGGYDQMTAYLGGFWDSMLGEGRRWWITATSDSHTNWRDGGSDFWPGEYSKTYVYAKKSYDDILEGIRNGRIFITTGDLISELEFKAAYKNKVAQIGGTLPIQEDADVQITIKLLDPDTVNHHGDNPQVNRVDLIVGEVTGKSSDLTLDHNFTTRVEKRYYAEEMKREGDYLVMTYLIKNAHHSMYLRLRGTNNTYELEPVKDHTGENPWDDLWFYSNPIFLEVK
ncbi:CehA/McbA family metallohydrolase domain-containing protein [Confluentibacter flavum]|uniref:Phosphoesterase n=1 Tax=Confluentibacter flavum TaxID=1909700 RepID=A0A2N3HPM2_9FLAO|nr:phosphoesterase [Confluentibacter flavum]PKQ46933.1 phosphoesterase [Confluentibacter flavum]